MRLKIGFNVIDSKKIPYGRYSYKKSVKNQKHTIVINKRLFTQKNLVKFFDVAYHEYTHYLLNLALRQKLMFWNEESLQEPVCKLIESRIQDVYTNLINKVKK